MGGHTVNLDKQNELLSFFIVNSIHSLPKSSSEIVFDSLKFPASVLPPLIEYVPVRSLLVTYISNSHSSRLLLLHRTLPIFIFLNSVHPEQKSGGQIISSYSHPGKSSINRQQPSCIKNGPNTSVSVPDPIAYVYIPDSLGYGSSNCLVIFQPLDCGSSTVTVT